MSSDLWGDPDSAIAKIEEQVAQAQEHAQRAQAVQEEIASLAATARSSRGEVLAQVAPTGRLVSIELNDDVVALAPRELARMIEATVQDAHSRAAAKAVEVTATAFGEDSPVTARLRDEADALVARPEPGLRYE